MIQRRIGVGRPDAVSDQTDCAAEDKPFVCKDEKGKQRLALHSASLTICHPETKKEISYSKENV